MNKNSLLAAFFIIAFSKSMNIQAQETTPTGVRIKAEAALSEMFGYIGDLRTMTSGRGQFSMEFAHYAACPKNIADRVIKEAAERDAAK